MGVRVQGRPSNADNGGADLKDAERLLNSLTGVVSARLVTSASGDIEEIHVLTTHDVSAKQTVRNVESALLAQLGINVDHRKISVAQTNAEAPVGNGQTSIRTGYDYGETRVLFLGHEFENENPHRLRARVKIEWKGERFLGEAAGTDLPKSRLEILANAVLQGLEGILDPDGDERSREGAALALDGVKLVDAFDRSYVLVGVHAIHGRDVKRLSGAAPHDDVIERAVILATLQATDRWVRGRL
ncbi:MAG: hypothetical protein R3223_13050 [Longimicrobiales bacterium]|nr:hypothetical protein [Longimicrobiales bacterium]